MCQLNSASSLSQNRYFLEMDLVEGATTHLQGERGLALHRAFLLKAVADVMPTIDVGKSSHCLQQILGVNGGLIHLVQGGNRRRFSSAHRKSTPCDGSRNTRILLCHAIDFPSQLYVCHVVGQDGGS